MEGERGVEIIYSPKFLRSIKRIDFSLKNKVIERIKLFQNYPFHASLKTHKLEGKHKDTWSFRITNNHRIIFRFYKEYTVLLEALITHDEYDRE